MPTMVWSRLSTCLWVKWSVKLQKLTRQRYISSERVYAVLCGSQLKDERMMKLLYYTPIILKRFLCFSLKRRVLYYSRCIHLSARDFRLKFSTTAPFPFRFSASCPPFSASPVRVALVDSINVSRSFKIQIIFFHKRNNAVVMSLWLNWGREA